MVKATTDDLEAALVGILQHEWPSGDWTVPRLDVGTTLGNSTQQLRLAYFTARRSYTSGSVRLTTGTAASGLTLCQVALFSIAGNGDGTQVAITANDTGLLTANSVITKAWSSNPTLTRGTRYAVGLLQVGTTTAQVYGAAPLGGSVTARSTISPRTSGLLNSQTSMPSSFTDASLTASGTVMAADILPV